MDHFINDFGDNIIVILYYNVYIYEYDLAIDDVYFHIRNNSNITTSPIYNKNNTELLSFNNKTSYYNILVSIKNYLLKKNRINYYSSYMIQKFSDNLEDFIITDKLVKNINFDNIIFIKNNDNITITN